MIEAAENIPGWMTADELRWLAEQAQSHKRIVEIGSWQGRSTKVLAGLADLVYSVDNLVGEWEGVTGDALDAEFRRHLAPEIDAGKVVRIYQPSAAAGKGFRYEPVDMVFIDGDHEAPAPADDIEAWLPHLRPGGLLCGHDDWHEGVQAAIADRETQSGPGGIWWEVV